MCTGRGKQEQRVLGSTVRSVLREAAAHGMQSIAMPLIGHGLAGWPAKLAAQIHVQQVLRFFNSCKASPSVKVWLNKMLTGDTPSACLLVYDVAHRLAMSLRVWWHLACMSTGTLCAYSKVASSCLSMTNGVMFA